MRLSRGREDPGLPSARAGINVDLPIISPTDYKAAGTVKLDIKNGGNLVCGVVSVAEDGLHAAEIRKVAQLGLSAEAGCQLAGPGLHPGS